MKLKKITNNSSEFIELDHKNGAKTALPPEVSLKDVDIVNLTEVAGKVTMVTDLTEVTENVGKTVLLG